MEQLPVTIGLPNRDNVLGWRDVESKRQFDLRRLYAKGLRNRRWVGSEVESSAHDVRGDLIAQKAKVTVAVSAILRQAERAMRVIMLAILFVGCVESAPKPKPDPLVDRLSKLPEVASVTVHIDGPKVVVHICDWHHVSREHFAAELPEDATEAEIDELYAEFLQSVADVQAEQGVVLRELAPDRVWLERLTDGRFTASLACVTRYGTSDRIRGRSPR